MKKLYLLLLVALTGCSVNRYYYVAEDPIELYEFSDYSGKPLMTANVGDTVSATGINHIQLGGTVPVEYRGYSFYAPSARARFLRIAKVRKKRDAAIPAVLYAGMMRRNEYLGSSSAPDNYGFTPSTGVTIHTGPRGGRFYYNSKGNKTYVKRSASSSTRSSVSKSYRSRSSGSHYRSSGRGRR